jgi:type II secretory pathway pseudopilin PulG
MTTGSTTRTRRAGAALIILLLLSAAALLLGMWYVRQKAHLPGTGTIDELASAVPADTQLFVALDARSITTMPALVEQLQQAATQRPFLQDGLRHAEQALGIPLKNLALWTSPAAFVILLPRPNASSLAAGAFENRKHPATVVAGMPLTDESAARNNLSLLRNSRGKRMKWQELDAAGSRMWVTGSGDDQWAYCVHHGYLLWGTSGDAVGRVASCLSGRAPSLGRTPLYREARHKIANVNGIVIYCPVRDAVAGVDTVAAARDYVDGDSMKSIAGVPYAIAGIDFAHIDGGEAAQAQLFVAAEKPAQSPLAHALLAMPVNDFPGGAYIPKAWKNYTEVNLGWLLPVAAEIGRLSTKSRYNVDNVPAMLAIGLGNWDIVKDLQSVTDGQVAFANNSDALYPKLLPQMFGQNLNAARTRGDYEACKNNLESIAKALEAWRAANHDQYPPTLAALTPTYLKSIPTCPAAGADTYSATYKPSSDGHGYSVACGGTRHAALGVPADMPAYNSTAGLVSPSINAPAIGQPLVQPQDVTWLVALHLKDEAGARGIIDKLEQKAGLKSTAVRKSGGYDVRGYEGSPVPLRWTTVSQPQPALLAAFGQDADRWMDEGIAALQKPQDQVASLPTLKRLEQSATGRCEQESYLDLGPLVNALGMVFKNMPDDGRMPADARGYFDVVAGGMQMVGSMPSFTVTSIEPDGVRQMSYGPCNPTTLLAVGGVLATVLVPDFVRSRAEVQLGNCASNLKNIGVAMDMYAADNAGQYPPTLGALAPNYLRAIPTCPAAASDTYSANYQRGTTPASYTLVCGGSNHADAGVATNYPQYTSTQGLVPPSL